MSRIAVVIPTFKRIKKLQRCLDSLEKQTYENFDVHIYCDNNDTETYNYIKEKYWDGCAPKEKIHPTVTLNSKQEFVIGSWNKFFRGNFSYKYYHKDGYDAVLWCVDDVELYPQTILNAYCALIKNFPDLDGVVGLKQECPGRPDYTFKWFGQCLIGRKFIERYTIEGHEVCCPDYKHFYQDEEMWEFADSINKFVNCEDAIIKHYHPAYLNEELDSTHPMVRGSIMQIDNATRFERQQKNLIWGQSWKRVR